MRKALAPVVVPILLGTLMAAPAAARRSIHFRSTDTGASISSTLSVFKDHDSLFGNGAGVLTLTSATSDRGTLYYGNATQTFRDKFKVGAPNAQGIAILSGSGHTIRGTGTARGLKSSYTFTGTFNTKTGAYTIHLTGPVPSTCRWRSQRRTVAWRWPTSTLRIASGWWFRQVRRVDGAARSRAPEEQLRVSGAAQPP